MKKLDYLILDLRLDYLTIVIRSLIEKNNKFYLEVSLNHCLYEINV